MKFIHTSDLHIGKTLNKMDLERDIEQILRQLADFAEQEQVDAVLICGDIYDTAAPSGSSSRLFSDFLARLCSSEITVLVIGGNHDQRERLQFGKEIFARARVFISGTYKKEQKPVVLKDKYGDVNFYMLPYVTENELKHAFPDKAPKNLQEGITCVLEEANVNYGKRNVLLFHQFVTSATEETVRSGSEIISVGGLKMVSSELFERFDYTALGHIHTPQKVGYGHIRYSGSPLQFSINEAGADKSFSLVELKEKGNITIRQIPFEPLRNVIFIKDKMENILNGDGTDDFVSVKLTDLQKIKDDLALLQEKFPNLLSFSYSQKEKDNAGDEGTEEIRRLFESNDLNSLYHKYVLRVRGDGNGLNEEEEEILAELMKGLRNETDNT